MLSFTHRKVISLVLRVSKDWELKWKKLELGSQRQQRSIINETDTVDIDRMI